MPIKRLHIFNTSIFLILMVVNAIIYINRDNGYAYKEFASYNQLYQAQEFNKIKGFKFINSDSIEVSGSEISLLKGNPRIKLLEGKHTYTLQNNSKNSAPLILGFNYVTKKVYADSGRDRNTDVELYYSNSVIDNQTNYEINDWVQTSEYTTDAEIKTTEQLIKDSVHIQSNDSAISKIKKIASYLLKHLNANRGTPSNAMDELSPLQQFNYVNQKKSKLWCGNFAMIFSHFSTVSGIKTRLVCTEGKINDVYKSGHSINECFIPELQKWIMIDLTSNVIGVQDLSHNYLNVIDVYNLHVTNSQNMTITTFKNDSLLLQDYKSVKPFYDYYFNNNTQLVYYLNSQFKKDTYSFLSKINRYTSTQPTFVTYSGLEFTSNQKFYLKQYMLYILISFSIYWIIASLMTIKKNRQ